MASRGESSVHPCRRTAATWLFPLLLLIPALAEASPHEARIPLKQGKVPVGDVSAAVCRELHVQPVRLPLGDLDLNGLNGSTFVTAVNGAMGDGLQLTLTPDALVLRVDPDRLPKDCDAAKRAVRVFTALEAPEATAAQRRHYGLHLPDGFDGPSGALGTAGAVGDTGASGAAHTDSRPGPRKPLVVLVHGLDSDCDVWGGMQALLGREGYAVATFGYPADGPIEESAGLLARSLADLRKDHPDLRIDIVAHSMGGLVARAYIEGDDYAGGIDHFILLGTPNHGSSWARWRWTLGVWEQCRQRRADPNWSLTWMITDGLGEAGDELKPKSKFLKALNARPRRQGVRYTIVAGNQHPMSQVGAGWAACASRWIPHRASHWWGFRQCEAKLTQEADSLRHRTGKDDGVVTLKSARLDGVPDFVVVPADHVTLALGDAPLAWDTIRDRLSR